MEATTLDSAGWFTMDFSPSTWDSCESSGPLHTWRIWMASLPAGMPRSFRDCRICYRYGAAKLFVRGGVFYERRVVRGVRLARSFFLPLVCLLSTIAAQLRF